jgi:hypothetical protein
LIRKATPSDLSAVVDLCIESAKRDKQLLHSRDRAVSLARECISSAPHFAWVAEKDGVIGGILLAISYPNAFHERNRVSVIQLYCTIRGDGIKLLREFMRWARSRPLIKKIDFTPEHSDPRIGKLLTRLGMQPTPGYTLTR